MPYDSRDGAVHILSDLLHAVLHKRAEPADRQAPSSQPFVLKDLTASKGCAFEAAGGAVGLVSPTNCPAWDPLSLVEGPRMCSDDNRRGR